MSKEGINQKLKYYITKLVFFLIFIVGFFSISNFTYTGFYFQDEKDKLTFKENPDKYLLSYGLIDIHSVDPSILVSLAYSTTKNILKKDMYGDLLICYLPKEVAMKLKLAQSILKKKNSKFSIIVLDGSRPLQIQKLMWDSLKYPLSLKRKYLSDPAKISLHNYGAALDLSIVDENGEFIDMGSPYDFFGEISKPSKEEYYFSKGKLTTIHLQNRRILRSAMLEAGFKMISNEWWHFNFCSREEAAKKFKLIH